MRAPPGPLRIFTYVTVEKTALYRAIMLAFVEAKARFALHLRPADVFATLAAGGAAEGPTSRGRRRRSRRCAISATWRPTPTPPMSPPPRSSTGRATSTG
jgi:hypothetical protein